MGRRPALEAYPHLHSVLRKDPAANAQFQACLSAATGPEGILGADTDKLRSELMRAQNDLSNLVAKYQMLLKTADKAKRVIKLLGGIMEPQLQFKSYMQDLVEKREYVVKFSPQNVRLFLQMYWDLVSQETEDIIVGRLEESVQEEEDS